MRNILVFIILSAATTNGLYAIGTYAEGNAIIQLNRMEERGLMYTSYEGEFVIADFDKDESCADERNECYTPIAVNKEFSVRPDNKKLIEFLKNNIGKEMLIKYKIHRFTPVSLGSNFELLDAMPWQKFPPDDLQTRYGVTKSGNKRAFVIFGRILKFDYRGTVIGTWEGIYFDSKRRKIHAFSVTDKSMAAYIFKAMSGRRQFFMAVSQSYVTATRDSDHDVYAIDYKKAPG